MNHFSLKKTGLLWAAGTVLLCLLFLFCGCSGERKTGPQEGDSGQTEEGEPILTLKNGDAVYDYEYFYFYSETYGDFLSYEENGAGFQDEAVLEKVRLYKARAAAAKEAGISFSDEELAQLFRRAEQFLARSFASEEAVPYQAENAEDFFLQYRGVNLEQFRRIYVELAFYEKYIEKLVESVPEPTGEELAAYYEAHEEELRAVNLLFAYFSVTDASGEALPQEEIDGKVRHAEEALAEIHDAEAMSRFVSEESEHLAAGESGSYYAYYKGDVIYPEFAPFCENPALSAGDKTVLQGDFGIYALYCCYIEDFESDTVRSTIRDSLILSRAEQTADAEAAKLL